MSKVENKQFDFYPGVIDQEIPKLSYETDFVVILPKPIACNGATTTSGRVLLDAVGESCDFYFYTEEKVDSTRKMYITFDYMRADAGADTITIEKYGYRNPCDGTTAGSSVWNFVADTLPASTNNRFETKTWELATATPDNNYVFAIYMNEIGKVIYVYCITVRYFLKKVL